MVEMMGGKIWVESAVGHGSAFHFTASLGVGKDVTKTPLLNAPGREQEPEGVAARRTVPEGRKLRLLLVEDDAVNQRLAQALLEKKGHRVTIAGNGREALAALDREKFDAVLMDVQMPEMDGFEATAAIRARERDTGRHLPIIAMTAYTMAGDRERCLKAGMDSYISKPLNFQELMDQLQRFSTADQ
jgi:CheY-like chemotaxis protein